MGDEAGYALGPRLECHDDHGAPIEMGRDGKDVCKSGGGCSYSLFVFFFLGGGNVFFCAG